MNIVITGASRGIGKSIALRFAEEGWDVAICARNTVQLQSVRAEILQMNPAAKVLAATADMSSKEEVLAFGASVLEHFSSVDVLVNNAGIFLPGAVYQEPEGQLERIMAVNLYSAYYLTRALLPAMIQQRSGHIINMCSTASLKAYPNGGSYGISKFALLGFSKNLREELKPHHIRVTAVCPGPTLTDSWAGFEAPKERFMPPEDIASIIWNSCNLAPQTDMEEIIIRPMAGDI